ncbi:MAG: hypothetical protein ACXIVD_06345 [Salinarimonas sp.]
MSYMSFSLTRPGETPRTAKPAWHGSAGDTIATLGVLTGLSLVTLLMTLTAAGFDDRMLYGATVWAKPAKFAASFALFFATLFLVAARLSERVLRARTIRITLAALVTAFLYELGYISLQAARGVSSHFNFSSIAPEIAFMLMGIGAVALMICAGAIGVIAARDREARLSPGLRTGVLHGFVWAAALTILVGGSISLTAGPVIGTPDSDASVPLLGWSLAAGDQRVAHFLALHAMQAGPLLGLAADRLGWREKRVRQGMLGYAALTLIVWIQALAGYPLIPA